MDNPVADYDYFTINELPRQNNRKTSEYSIVSKSGGYELGKVKWYGPWRQFCFFPNQETIWSEGCQKDILDFIDKLKANRKQSFGWS